jgi:flagellar biosynthesis regulator FlbT
MRNTLKISLKPNEKIYVNGAVIRTTPELRTAVQHTIHPASVSVWLRQPE